MSNRETIYVTADNRHLIEREYNRVENTAMLFDEVTEKLEPADDKFWVYCTVPCPAMPRYLGSFDSYDKALAYLDRHLS